MTHRLPVLLAAISLVCLWAVGCQTQTETTSHSDFTSQTKYEVDPFVGEPDITADTHFVAGQMHETHTVTEVGKPVDARAIAIHRRKAVEQYAKALRLDPNHTGALHRCATLLATMKQYDASIEYWNRYVTAVGETPDALVNLAITQEVAGLKDDAAKTYRKAIAKNPTHKTANVNLGMLLARDGELQEAARLMSDVLEPAAVHWHLAHALEARGDQKAAERHYRAAQSLDGRYRRDAQASATTDAIE
ncbi:MAG: tetratricopeptide repeat protein [Planctomycetota bacterium]